jgi:hypothetical protein
MLPPFRFFSFFISFAFQPDDISMISRRAAARVVALFTRCFTS